MASHSKQSMGQRRPRPKTALPKRPVKDMFEADGEYRKGSPEKNLAAARQQNYMNPSSYEVGGQSQATVQQTQGKPQWFDSNAKLEGEEWVDVTTPQREKPDADLQGAADYH